MNYTDNKDYKAKIKNSSEWRKANDYEVFAWNICMECVFYKPEPAMPIHGECQLMADNGCYDGVLYTAVCNKYVNKRGYDLNGKIVMPELLPKGFPTKNGQVDFKAWNKE